MIIDEVGYLPLAAEAAAALFQVITQRYLKGSIVLTTNLGVASWGKIFDDPTVAAAMLDRLLHRSVVFNITARATACAPTAPAPTNSAEPRHRLPETPRPELRPRLRATASTGTHTSSSNMWEWQTTLTVS